MSVNWVDTVTVDETEYNLKDSGSVRYDESQSLTDAQKETARNNIGASSGSVKYDESQSLTDAQKATARDNIGASSDGDLDDLSDEVDDLKSALEDNDIIALLHMDEINDTVQSIVFDSVGNVSTITHVRNNVMIREDEFAFGDGTITEVRTLNTGETLTIVTNTNTLQTTITYAAA